MRTQAMIGLIVTAIVVASVGVLVVLVVGLGWVVGGLVGGAAGTAIVLLYRFALRPWHLRWGATDDEVVRSMPGDELVPSAQPVTRAITIGARPDQVWPWLLQLGYGKAGWYSYDWIDNDFRKSADRVMARHQQLVPGDRILMMPDMGFVVQSVDHERSIVSLLEDSPTSWCLALDEQADGTTRLISRWRPTIERTAAGLLMNVVIEPGTFLMEQKMLRTLRDRVEAATRRGPRSVGR